MSLRIVLLGPPGAGKGTQSVLLAQQKGIPHISTGEMLRQSIAEGSDIGKKAKEYLDRGDLIPDDLMVTTLRMRLGRPDCEKGFLLDGFPRTVNQAVALDAMLAELRMELTHVVAIAVPEGVLMDRIKSRAASGSGRSDDNDEVAAKRLKVFWEQTAPVIGYYRQHQGVKEVDGLGTIDEVAQRIASHVS